MRRLLTCAAKHAGLIACALSLLSCHDGKGVALPPLAPTSTPSGLPTTIALAPDFTPIDGARADYGRLNGGTYEIEIPQNWNSELVVYFQGSQRYSAQNDGHVSVRQPPLRTEFIAEGYAWAATSYDTSEYISGAAATQNAVLWDYFARKYGKPKRTYAIGDSMGGAGELSAVETYADRFSGAVVLCGIAGVQPIYDQSADFVAAGAYVAGITQDEYETTRIDILFHKVHAAMVDPATRPRFLQTWLEMTGGPRAFALAGFLEREDALWGLAQDDLLHVRSSNVGRAYHFDPGAPVNEADFNDKVVRIDSSEAEKSYDPGDPTGAIKAPVLLMHTTGDGIVPISEFNLNVQRIKDSGKQDLLSLRTYDAAGHCEFTRAQQKAAFDDLVQWVKKGTKPPDEFDLPSGN